MNAAHFLRYGAKILSGRKCQHPAVVQAFCAEGEQLAGFVCIGTPRRELEPREKDDPGPQLSECPPEDTHAAMTICDY